MAVLEESAGRAPYARVVHRALEGAAAGRTPHQKSRLCLGARFGFWSRRSLETTSAVLFVLLGSQQVNRRTYSPGARRVPIHQILPCHPEESQWQPSLEQTEANGSIRNDVKVPLARSPQTRRSIRILIRRAIFSVPQRQVVAQIGADSLVWVQSIEPTANILRAPSQAGVIPSGYGHCRYVDTQISELPMELAVFFLSSTCQTARIERPPVARMMRRVSLTG